MSTEDAAIGLDSPAPRSTMPYSVSMPQTLRIATSRPYWGLEILPRRHPLDRPATFGGALFVLGDQRADVDDALALLARDLRPVVRVRRVREVLVLLELLVDRRDEVLEHDALLARRDVPLDRELLGATHDVLDHGARREVLEVHDLLVAVLVGHLQELVGVVSAVHRLDGLLEDRL